MHAWSDQQLVRAARGGDGDAAAELLGRHMQASWAAAYALLGRPDLADDATQDAFERAIRYLDRFDAEREFRPWLHRIVVNCSLDTIAARKRRGEDALDEERFEGQDLLGAKENVLEIVGALAEIPVERRAVVVLRLVGGYSPQEVADLLGTPVGTVNSRLSRGLAELRGRLEILDEP